MAEISSHNEHNDKTIFGFWVYLMTDLIMFAALFASYAVLKDSTFGGPPAGVLLTLPNALAETLILLTSSFTCGMATLAAQAGNIRKVLAWLGITFALGLTFLIMEITEFRHLIIDGHGPDKSAFLSSYFSLVGTHGLHIAVGLLWILVSMIMVWKRGLSSNVTSKLTRLALFWHFLDIVWIFIFTIVYLMGVL